MTMRISSERHTPGLNRNILECKYKRNLIIYRLTLRLNRNILECKYSSVVEAVT